MSKKPDQSRRSRKLPGASANPTILALEKRIAFDGAASHVAAKLAKTPLADFFKNGQRDTVTLRQFEHQIERARDPQPGGFDSLFNARLLNDLRDGGAKRDRSVVFIEADVPDLKDLVANIDRHTRIVLLDPSKDGVDLITNYLAAHPGMKNVYIFSHGGEAMLNLGTASLDSASMTGRYAGDLATIKSSLAANANILVYGCDFAKNVDGDGAAHLLSSLTGASVAASTNPTGGTADGGDFVLEDQVGHVTAPDILSSRIALEFNGLLAAQTTGAFTINTGTSGTATSSATIATAYTADGAVKIVVTVTPNSSNSANSITTTTSGATFDTTAPAGTYPTTANGASALEETLQFGGTSGNGKTDGTNGATISIAYFDASTGAAITVTNPIIYIDRIGGSGANASGNLVSNSSDLTVTSAGATLTKLGASSTAFNVTSTDVYETVNTTLVTSGFSTDANSDPTKGTSAGAVQVNGSYSTVTFNWAKAANSVNGGDRIDLIFSADTGLIKNGTLPNQTYNDGQSGVSIATSQAFSNPSGLSTTYSAAGLPAGLTINATTGQITGTVDHDASKNAPATSGSGATLDGTYTVTVTAKNSAGNSTTQTFTIDSKNQAPTVGTKTANQTNNDGDTITAVNAAAAFSDPNGDPLIYSATGLPAGLTISSAGMITGTVAKNATPGTYSVLVTGTDDKGAATTETFSWVIKDVPPTKNGSLPNQVYSDGQSGVSIATSQGFSDSLGNSLTYSVAGLPTGLSINATTGQITGTVDHDASKNAPTTSGSGATLDGTYTVTVAASDGLGGMATQTFTIDSKNTAPTVGTKTANQTNNDGDTIATVNAAAAFSDSNGDPLTYSATGLPPGLSISSAGLITGAVAGNATPGTYNVTVTATDDKGAATTETFSWAIKDVPPTKNGTLPNQVYTDGQTGISISTSQGFTATNGNALTYSVAGLPAGLTINTTTGQITGTVDHDASKNAPVTSGSGATLDGTYTATVTASDGLGGTATQTFTIDSKNTAPTVGTKTATQTNNDGDTITAVNAAAAFSDPNGDTLTYTASNLPAGLTISSAGMITGTVAGNATPGTYSVTVTATDDKGAATSETFSWVIKDVPPAKNGTLPNQVYTDGQSGISIATSQGFTASNGNSLTYSIAGLPAGLSINATTGQITGTVDHDASKNAPAKNGSGATLDGTYTVTVTASDGLGGTATQTFTIDSKNTAPTVGTKTANQTNNDGDTITAVNAATAFSDPNGDPLTYSATGLPPGLEISSAGMITGTVAGNAAPGTYSVVVAATDDKGASTSETFSWVIKDVPPAKNGTVPNQTTTDGQTGISISTSQGFTATNGNALTYSVSGLPAGLSINATTGQITGTVDHDASKNAPVTSGSGATLDGTYTVTVTASDGLGGTATQTFTIDSKNTAPTLGTKTANQTNNDGDMINAVNAAAAFSDPNGDPLTYSATGLPPGLTISSAGLINGTVAGNATPGTYSVIVTGTDDKGATTSETFSWVIKDVPPAKNGTLPNQTTTDGQAGISISTSQGFTATNGNALTYSVAGLPAGLAINSTTGQITGTVDHDASKNAPVTSGSGATLDGTYTVTVNASDGLGGSATQTFTIDSKNTAPTVGTKTANQTNNDGDTITAVNAATAFSDPNGDTLTYTASNLPAGLTISSAGMITGTVAGNAAPGTYTVTVTATDDKGAAASETFSWVIKDVPPSKNGTLSNQVYTDGQTGVSISTSQGFAATNGNALTYSASGLPAGLTINATTGQITGTVDHDASKNAPSQTGSGATLDGKYTVTVTASDGLGGTATQTFTVDSKNTAPALGIKTADQTNNDGDTITAVNAAAAFSDPNGDQLTYTAANLPAGLTISSAGLITGTVVGNATPGTYIVTVTATDDKGAATAETFNWVIKDIPPAKNGTLANQTTTDGQAGISIATSQGFTATNGNALSYSVSGLPAGLSINATTGQITGTIDHDASKNAPITSGSGATLDGTYTVTVTASDGLGGTATQTFTIDSKNTAPTVGTRTADQTNNDGDTIATVNAAAAFSDPNGDPLTFSATGLPPGLSISSTGKITGTVAGNATPGTYSVMVTATDDKGAATTETFSWLIKDVPPAKNGTLPNQTTSDGQTGVSISTSQGFTSPHGNPLTYSVAGLPAGLSIDATTGQITGTVDHDASKNAPVTSGTGATLDGTYTVTVTASDGLGGTATQTFTIDSKNTAPTVGTKTADQTNSDGDTVTAVNAASAFSDPNGDPLTYSATNLPPGLTISAAGVITGTVAKNAQPGTYAVMVTATDDKGATTTDTFNWVIKDVPPTANGTLANQTTTDGQSGISISTSQGFDSPNGNPLTYSTSGLPAGLSINATTGVIAGTIDHDASKNAPSQTGSGATLDGKYTVTVTANDGLGGTATQTFTIDSKNTAPTVGAKTADQTNSDGDTVTAVNAASAFSDPNGDPLTYSATNLPPGLTISAAGVISGTVAKNAQPGTYAVVVTATDDKGAATTETFNWVIKDVPPTMNGTLANQVTTDGQTGVSIATSQGFNSPNGNPLTYSVTGLPAGLTINAMTGVITGTVDHDASKNAPVTSGSGATLDGTYTVVVTASDGLGGTATQTFKIDSTNQAPVVGTRTANQTNPDGATITPVDTSKAFTDPNGDPLTYSVSGLPAGLTINAATGVITGTIANNAMPGTYTVRVLATDDKGAAIRETFTWTVTNVPPTTNGTIPNQTYADSQASISISTAQAFTSPTGNPLTYSATGLPLGLSIDQTTGKITGQLDHDASKNAPTTTGSGATLDGKYTVTVTASDGQGGTATQSFTIDAKNTAPTLTAQTPDQTGANGQQVSLNGAKAFADANTGDTLTYAASGLPTGLTINASTGLISGTIDPHASSTGPYTVTITVTDDKGAATTDTFKWTVNDVPPVATPALPDKAANDGSAVTLTTASGFTNPNNVAYTYTATGLPSGLTIDVNSGVISGTLNHDASIQASGGVYTIAVTANDGQGGTATNTFHLTASNQAPVVGTKTANQANADGDVVTPVDALEAFSDPNGDPLTYAASNLPAGLTIDPNSGLISGTVAANAKPGTYSVTVTATDDKGVSTPETFTWTIADKPPVTADTIPNRTFADSTPGISIDASTGFTSPNGLPLSYTATGLPAGLMIDPATGKISGTLAHDASLNAPSKAGAGATLDGKYTVVVTASDGQGGTATQTFTIDATNNAPVVGTKTTDQSNIEGDPVSVNASTAFSDPNKGDTLTYSSTNLPAGLTIDATTGVISGSVMTGDHTSSPYTVMVTATDEKGAATTEAFTWTVVPLAPGSTAPIQNVSTFDGSSVTIDTASHFTNAPTSYSASGLPPELTIDPTTGLISGTLDHDASAKAPVQSGSGATLDGKYTITVTATNAGGSATQTFTLDSVNQAPTLGTRTTDQTSTTGQTIATVDASTSFTDPNHDTLTYSATGLPTGLAISGTGQITGTISATSPGTYSVVVTATDNKGAATSETFAWTVTDRAPTANGTLANQTYADSASITPIATSGAFTSPNGLPLTYSASGLPAGLSIDPTSGQITGQLDHDASANAPSKTGSGATLDGKYTIVVTASDGQGGTATQTFTIDAANTAPTVVAQTTDQHGADGQSVSLATSPAFKDPNAGDTLTYSASNLPKGLTIDTTTGLISGTIDPRASAASPYTVTVTATDDKGAPTTETFKFTVDNVGPTATPPLPDQSVYDGSTVTYTTANGFANPNGLPLTYSAPSLPSGLTINGTTGVISGTLNHDASAMVPGGVYTIAVTADDGQGGTATNTFRLTASNQAPFVGTKTTDQANTDGQTITPVDASLAFSDPNVGDKLTYTASNLPAGLSIDANTGKISGTIAANATPGDYYVTVTATDDKGAATPETFHWTVTNVPPQAVGTLPNETYADSTAGISIVTSTGFSDPNHLALTYSATGLPTGLTIDPTTGEITGSLSHNASRNAPVTSGSGATLDGTYTVTVTADDGQGGKATQTFKIDATNQPPIVGSNTANQHSADGQTVSVDAAQAFSDPNTGDTLMYAATGLPKGLAIDPTSGRITGRIDPRASSTPSYTVMVTATDNKGAPTTETFTWTIDNVPPTSGAPISPATGPDGQAITPIDTASHFNNPNSLPLTYSASGLPAGLTIDPTTGQITGTLDHDASKNAPMTSGSGATLDGTYTVTVTADDGQGGKATQTFTFDATNQAPVVGTATANQRSADSQAVSLDASQAFSDPNTGDVITYTVTNLPKGVAINPTTGRITGTIDPKASNISPYAVTVTATDEKGAATSETFTWTIDNTPPTAGTAIPPAMGADGQTIAPIDTASHFNNPNGLPLTYGVTGLPAGLSIDPMTGQITGTVDHDASKNAPVVSGSGATLDGTYTVTVAASDGQGGTATQTFTFDARNNAPVIGTATADQHSADGKAVSVNAGQAFSDPNTGDTLTYTATGLPKGLAIDSTTGQITGTIDPKASANGSYTVQVTATDDKGAATTETFTWMVDDTPPTAGAPVPPATGADGQPIAPIDTAAHFDNSNGLPLTYSVTGLPAGLSIDPTTGQITGTFDHDASKNAPMTSGSGGTLDGTYTVTVTASDAQGGTATQTFTIDAKNSAPVIGTKTPDQANADGATVSIDAGQLFSDPNTGDTLTYTATGLPKGVAIDPTTGQITGTIDPKASASSPYTVAVTATDDKGAATTETFTWTVNDVPPTAGSPLPPAMDADGQAITPIDTASHFGNPNGLPLTYSVSGLPAGLSIDPTTGQITGTVDHDASKNAPVTSGSGATLDGSYTVTVTASDGQGGTATQIFTFDARNNAPVVGMATADQHNGDGQPVSVDAGQAFSDPNTGDTLTFAATGLPKGLALDPTTGQITGTIDPKASASGPYTVTVTATDDKGAATTESFIWTIDNIPPTAGAPVAAATGADGQPIAPIDTASHFDNPNSLPLTYSVTGLPAGLSIDPATGKITGTVDHDASKNAPVTSGSGATLDGTYTITVTADDGQGGKATQTFTFDATNAAPVITARTPDQQGTDGQVVSLNAGSAFADPNGDPLTYAASGLPKGLAIDPATGRITGTIDPVASANGPYTVTVTATDDKGAATTEAFTWAVGHDQPVATSPIPSVVAGDGNTISPIDAASHFNDPFGLPLTYSATGLPPGLSIDPTTGRITGTLDPHAARLAPQVSGQGVTLDGTYTVKVTADNGRGGLATQTFTVDATNSPPVVGNRTPNQAGVSGQPASVDTALAFSDPNGGDTLTYSANGLPPGLTIDPNSGRISGTPSQGAGRHGPYTVTVTATDSDGATVSETFVWTISPVAPSILPLARNIPPTIFDVEPAPTLDVNDVVLDTVNLFTGDRDQTISLRAQDIVLSTVDNMEPLERLQPLDTPGAGIVRSGAATNERGDSFGQPSVFDVTGLGSFTTSTYVGASLRNPSLLTGSTPTTINVETMVRDGVLTLSFDTASKVACVVPTARYEVTLSDGEQLPSWLRVDGQGVVSGKVPPGLKTIDIKVRAILANGIAIERVVTLRPDNGAMEFATPAVEKHAERTLSDMLAEARDATVMRVRLSHML